MMNKIWKKLCVMIAVLIVIGVADAGAPSVTNPVANPGTIAADGIQEFMLNVSAVDDTGVDVVVIDLTPIGGSMQIMSNAGDSLYSTSTNASLGIPPGTYHLQVNATDLLGNYNNTVRITLNVVSAVTWGDVNRNGRRDTGDATLILRNIVGLPIPPQYLPILPTGDMNCNNRIDTGDATLVLRDIVNLPIPRCWE